MVANDYISGKLTALVLAADRTPNDPVTRSADVACKAFAPVVGMPMVLRVLDALESSKAVKETILAGPPEPLLPACPELQRRLTAGRVSWRASLESPSRSAEAVIAGIDESAGILLTTADHALLTPEIVSFFVSRSLQSGADATVGLVEYNLVAEAFPKVRRTVTRLRDGGFCGCNLYALLSPPGRRLVSMWRSVEQSRKRPARLIAGLLGPRAVFAYLTRTLTLDGALAAVSHRLDLTVRPVLLPFGRAGVDVDTVDDLRLVESVLRGDLPST